MRWRGLMLRLPTVLVPLWLLPWWRRASLALEWLRTQLRASDGWFIALSLVVGGFAGTLASVQSAVARAVQRMLYGLPPGQRLSAMEDIAPLALLVLPLGGLALGLFNLLVRARRRPLVDAVEANALHGGRMSMRDSLIVSAQTVFSNGSGASVGLEAAYAQLGGGIGSLLGRWMRVRRADMRTLVGAGAGGAIGAAFGAPLTGAFYAFEIVIGAYSPSALAPVAVAAIGAILAAQALGATPYALSAEIGKPIAAPDYFAYAVLGMLAALVGIVIMRAVTGLEGRVKDSPLPHWLRPAVGGLLLVPLVLLTPQVLSGGHGALYANLGVQVAMGTLALVLLAKCLASIITLGFGFRGGLFFASLFIGTLVGHLFAEVMAWLAGIPVIDPRDAALVGMAALASAVVGGPLTMSMLVLEATHDFGLTSAVVLAVLISNTIVRQMFGYSFSTWRLHLRGETIKSASDIGWIRSLNAARIMRKAGELAPARLSPTEFRQRFPLGSTSRVVLLDDDGGYAGIVTPPVVFSDRALGVDNVGALIGTPLPTLRPDQDIRSIMQVFDRIHGDELVVVDAENRVLGTVSETFVRRRYAEELEKRQREMLGERF